MWYILNPVTSLQGSLVRCRPSATSPRTIRAVLVLVVLLAGHNETQAILDHCDRCRPLLEPGRRSLRLHQNIMLGRATTFSTWTRPPDFVPTSRHGSSRTECYCARCNYISRLFVDMNTNAGYGLPSSANPYITVLYKPYFVHASHPHMPNNAVSMPPFALLPGPNQSIHRPW
jgi:hypothetical protein